MFKSHRIVLQYCCSPLCVFLAFVKYLTKSKNKTIKFLRILFGIKHLCGILAQLVAYGEKLGQKRVEMWW